MRPGPVAALVMILLVGWGGSFPADSRPAAAEAAEDDFQGLPDGPGRETVFYTCQACHSLKTVLQQRLSRDVWDETLQWMIEEQGMPEPAPSEYARILDYLGTYLTPR